MGDGPIISAIRILYLWGLNYSAAYSLNNWTSFDSKWVTLNKSFRVSESARSSIGSIRSIGPFPLEHRCAWRRIAFNKSQSKSCGYA